MNYKVLTVTIFIPIIMMGCAGIPLDALVLSSESLKTRQLQTRKFDTSDEKMVLSSCAALLQDLGFIIEESETELGLILGTKTRSAVRAGEVATAVVLAILGTRVPTDKEQLMRASVVTRPIGEQGSKIAVRVTFQRIVWNTDNKITKQELIHDVDIYLEFFDKLSKSIFLEAQQL